MEPSVHLLQKVLYEKVVDIFNSVEREQLTVNLIRKRVAEEEGLGEEFSNSDEWKQLSKKTIKETYTKLLDDEEKRVITEKKITRTKSAPKKRGTKKPSPEPDEEDDPPLTKRQKKSRNEKHESKHRTRASKKTTSDLDDGKISSSKTRKKSKPKEKLASDDEDESSYLSPQPEEVSAKKPANKAKVNEIVSDKDNSLSDPPSEGNMFELESNPEPLPRNSLSRLKTSIEDDDSDNNLSDPPNKKTRPTKTQSKITTNADDDAMEDIQNNMVEKKIGVHNAEDDSDMSIVIDTLPAPRRRGQHKTSKEAHEAAPKKVKKRDSTGMANKKESASLSEAEQLIKKLQQQLLKCGVRKIWAFELKEYGNDTLSKIKHLRRMLEDIGMTGRFSETKAAQIKEQRELMADLEAVQEGNKHWGAGGTEGHPKRSLRTGAGRKPKYKVSNTTENENHEDDESDTRNGSSTRWRDQQAALAALLDDEDSD